MNTGVVAIARAPMVTLLPGQAIDRLKEDPKTTSRISPSEGDVDYINNDIQLREISKSLKARLKYAHTRTHARTHARTHTRTHTHTHTHAVLGGTAGVGWP